MKRRRTQDTTSTPIRKKPKDVKPSSPPSNLQGIAYGRFTHAQIHNIFLKKLGGQADKSTIELLTCLFLGVASPEAISQLQNTCCLRRTSDSSYLFPNGDTTHEAMKALDNLEHVLSTCSIIRRYYLLYLTQRRECLVQQHKLKPAQRTRTRDSGVEKIQKAESLALQDLYYEAYRERDPSTQLQTKIKNRLRQERNWAFLVQKFSIGVLALLPTGSKVVPADSQIERVQEQNFLVFLDILQQERGEFIQQIAAALDQIHTDILFNSDLIQHYHAEEVVPDVIRHTSFDDESLLEYCTKTPNQMDGHS